MIYEIETEMKEKYSKTQWRLVFHSTKIISMCIPTNICESEMKPTLFILRNSFVVSPENPRTPTLVPRSGVLPLL